MNKQKSKSECL